MGTTFAIITFVLTLAAYIFYRIGLKVKEKEALIEKMFDEAETKKKIDALQTKYSKKRTPKVPTIKH